MGRAAQLTLRKVFSRVRVILMQQHGHNFFSHTALAQDQDRNVNGSEHPDLLYKAAAWWDTPPGKKMPIVKFFQMKDLHCMCHLSTSRRKTNRATAMMPKRTGNAC